MGLRILPVPALLTMAVILTGACSGSDQPEAAAPATASPVETTAAVVASPSVLGPVPDEARVSSGGGEPRSAGYWVMWSSCGENSQAALAKANGGREAGWALLDDLIANPGLSLGSFEVTGCDSAVALLRAASETGAGGVPRLSSVLLLAEANLAAGAESCAAVEGVVRASQALLGVTGFQGDGSARELTAQESALAAELGDVLTSYSTGELCR